MAEPDVVILDETALNKPVLLVAFADNLDSAGRLIGMGVDIVFLDGWGAIVVTVHRYDCNPQDTLANQVRQYVPEVRPYFLHGPGFPSTEVAPIVAGAIPLRFFGDIEPEAFCRTFSHLGFTVEML